MRDYGRKLPFLVKHNQIHGWIIITTIKSQNSAIQKEKKNNMHKQCIVQRLLSSKHQKCIIKLLNVTLKL